MSGGANDQVGPSGQYYNMKFYSGDKPKKIEEEVRAQLFKVPNEEEIEGEMKEVDKLKKLEEEYLAKKKDFDRQNAKINVTKQEKIENEQKRLAQRLELLVNEPKEDNQEDIYKMIALKRKIAESQKQELSVLEQQFLLSKEKEIEEKVRRKIELERVLEEKTKLNDKFSKLKMEIDMVKAEEDDRIADSAKYVAKALQRNVVNPFQSDALKKGMDRAGISGKSGAAYISEEDQKLLGKAMLDGGVQDQREKELVLKEIQARREQEKRKVQLEISEKQRSLNDQRFEIMEESEKLLKKKMQHYELQKKGVEFLANIEQGLAPPIEFIMKNLGDGAEDQYRSEATIEDIVSRAKKFAKIGSSRIQFMKSEHEQFYGYDPYDKPYRGELKPMIQRMNPENVYISRLIIDWLMELVIRKHLENQNDLAATREKQHYLQEKAKRIQKNVDMMTNAQSYVEIRDRILNNVIDKLIREAAFEIATVNQMAKTISLNLIVRAIKGGRNSGNSEAQLSKIFYSLRNSDMTKKNDPNFRFNYKDMAKIEDPAAAAKRKKEEKKKQQQQAGKEDGGQKGGEENPEEDDQTVLQIYPEVDCVEMLGTQEIIKLEIDYWNSIKLEHANFIPHNPKKKFNVSALAISFNKELVAVGFSNGSVQIFSTVAFPAVQIAQVEEAMPKRIVHMEFAFDNMSQLLLIDEEGNFSVNFNAYNLKSAATQKAVTDNVLVMKQYYGFNWKMLTRSGKVNTQEANRIAFACFHPGITFTGLQPTVFIGSEQGLIMKFNSNKDLYKGIVYKFPIHNVVNCAIITNQDMEFPTEHNKTLVITDNHNENSEKHINIFREFFVEHKSKILIVVFLNKPETFITVDTRGYVYYWVYEKDQYLVKIDGYQAKAKYKVSCGVMTFIPKTSANEFGEPNSQKIDFNQGGMSKDEGGAKYFSQIISENKEYEKDLVNLRYNQSENLRHIADIIVTKEQFPTESGQEVTFYKGRVNFREEKFEALSEDKYISQLVEGQVDKCIAIHGNQYIIIQQILPHKVDPDRAYVQFIRFDTGLFRLKKVRIRLESPDVEDIDFTVLEDFGPFGTPYLFVLMRQGLFVASLATGSILMDFKKHLNLIQAEAKLATLATANFIKHVLDKHIIIGSAQSNGVYPFSIVDTNSDDLNKDAFTFQQEYRRLYAI